MQDPPTAADLLEAMADFLEKEVLPEHQGRKAFHIRVVVNLCRLLARESRLETAFLEEEAAALRALLGQTPEVVQPQHLAAEARRLNQELASRIRSGQMDYRQTEILGLVKELVRRKLLVARPDYIEAGKESPE